MENNLHSYELDKPSLIERTARFFELSVNSVLNSAVWGALPRILIASAGAATAGLVTGVIGAGAMMYGGYKYQQRTKRKLA